MLLSSKVSNSKTLFYQISHYLHGDKLPLYIQKKLSSQESSDESQKYVGLLQNYYLEMVKDYKNNQMNFNLEEVLLILQSNFSLSETCQKISSIKKVGQIQDTDNYPETAKSVSNSQNEVKEEDYFINFFTINSFTISEYEKILPEIKNILNSAKVYSETEAENQRFFIIESALDKILAWSKQGLLAENNLTFLIQKLKLVIKNYQDFVHDLDLADSLEGAQRYFLKLSNQLLIIIYVIFQGSPNHLISNSFEVVDIQKRMYNIGLFSKFYKEKYPTKIFNSSDLQKIQAELDKRAKKM